MATLPPDEAATSAARGGEVGADGAGRMLAQLNAGRIAGDARGRLDSPYVALVSRATGIADTIGRIRPALRLQVGGTTGPDGRQLSGSYTFPPFTGFEQATLFPDGWVAIARLDPYRVDWRAPNGQWLRGSPIPIETIQVDGREKRAYLARMWNPPATPPDPSTISDWPTTVPAFEALRGSVVLNTPGGELLIARTPTARQPGRHYDVIARSGNRTAQLLLPEGERVVGFGSGTVYVAVTDDDGIQRLQRHPWP